MKSVLGRKYIIITYALNIENGHRQRITRSNGPPQSPSATIRNKEQNERG